MLELRVWSFEPAGFEFDVYAPPPKLLSAPPNNPSPSNHSRTRLQARGVRVGPEQPAAGRLPRAAVGPRGDGRGGGGGVGAGGVDGLRGDKPSLIWSSSRQRSRPAVTEMGASRH